MNQKQAKRARREARKLAQAEWDRIQIDWDTVVLAMKEEPARRRLAIALDILRGTRSYWTLAILPTLLLAGLGAAGYLL